MDLKKRCQWCGKYFIAHKMTNLYCSSSCIDKAYKAKKKQQIKEQVEEEQQSKLPIVGSIGQKPFLSPPELYKQEHYYLRNKYCFQNGIKDIHHFKISVIHPSMCIAC